MVVGPALRGHDLMSATLSFIAGLLTGAAAMLGATLLWRAPRAATGPGRKLLLGGGLAAGVTLIFAISLAVGSHQGAGASPGESVASDAQPPPMSPAAAMPTATMPSPSVMSQVLAMPRGARAQMAQPMDRAAATLAARLERQGGTAADWNLLAQAYDFLGRPEDAQRARARAAKAGTVSRTP